MSDNKGLAGWVETAEQIIIASLFAAMTLLTFTQVVLRYLFNSGFVWALEATTYLFAWLVLFGAAYGIKHGVHLGVDAFVHLFNSKIQRFLGLAAVAAGLTYTVIMFIGSWNYEVQMYTIGIEAEDIPVERWILRLILPIGIALLALRLAQQGWMIWKGETTGLIRADEASEAIRQFEKENLTTPEQRQ